MFFIYYIRWSLQKRLLLFYRGMEDKPIFTFCKESLFSLLLNKIVSIIVTYSLPVGWIFAFYEKKHKL